MLSCRILSLRNPVPQPESRMSDHDDITEEQLRQELVAFARLVMTLDAHGALVDRSASLLRLLGELRRMVFAFELACTDPDAPVVQRSPGWQAARRAMSDDDVRDDLLRQSRRIVREATRREAELTDEWSADDDPTLNDD